ncbi:SusC/RagA family TonB-linked outer membrane protein [Chitinophaga sancti]|uniref:TonB-dependent receptor n=1 Tax=Chitinophaga sancti TaxID=1004 RepID=A0A1K1R724_9BACT|nr:TonB-dependent receptor [Chitinophaga sancti]WQD64162.1 TonB-dependent receptor [Chitinophaga sancti]WQG90214.1 TonB-dependent receptor [Chitinophaga sancti]SFW67821.1 TonB-linked outer membrane protein, SusC/RagA family [Chitinophaga sancti]
MRHFPLMKTAGKTFAWQRTTIALLLLFLHSHLSGQTITPPTVTIKGNNMTLEAVFKSIEQQTDITFFYSGNIPKNDIIGQVNYTNAKVTTVLDDLLKGRKLAYEIKKNVILIRKEDKPATVASTAPAKDPPATQEQVITGQVIAEDTKAPLPMATVMLKGTNTGATTDQSGFFKLKLTGSSKVLLVQYVGYETREINLNGKSEFEIMLSPKDNTIKDVVVVAYGTQKKTSMVSSITTINPKELKGPTSNLTTMLAGKIAGVISYQRSGEPGADNAQFFIRGVGTFGAGKVDPLILIDNIESSSRDLARLQPDDIAGFSVLKDATASALYGARGANGVILVTTKTGTIGKMKFNFRVENANSSNTRNFALADNITYMNLANEAALTRNPLSALPYSQNKIDHTAAGDDPLLYPNNNWIKQLIKNRTNNQRYNVNASGGSDKAKYYLAMTYNIDNGILKENKLNNFSNNIKLRSYSLLSNVTLNLTKTTEALVSLKGQFDDYNGPIGGGAAVFNNAIWSNPVAFPAVYPAELMPYVKHPLFGNAIIPGGGALYVNPYAKSISGFQATNTSTLTAQLSLKQNLDAITPGLSARVMAYTTRYAYFAVTRQYSPYYYTANTLAGKFTGLTLINDGSQGSVGVTPTEYLTYTPGDKIVNSTTYAETALNYSRTFKDKHSVGGMLIGTIRNYVTGNASSLQLSLPSRNLGLSGRFTYGYDNRYLLEYNFGFNGSERFAANHRFGFFPSIGGGYIVSNEKFFEPLSKTVQQLKFRFTYGLVGNDQIGNSTDRFFYLSDVNLNGGATGYFGTQFNYSRPTVAINRYENKDITWELSRQTNIGMDLTIFKDLTVTVDAYRQLRSNILMVRSTIPSSMGLKADISANSGKASSKGIDLMMNYLKTFEHSLWIQARGTLTLAKSKLLVNEEPQYAENNGHLSKVGNSLGQIYGLVAEKLFVDDAEVSNSPIQYGRIMAGDIKYRDVNGDGTISNADYVPIGFPTTPEMIYGLLFSVGYKNFDISAAFQGSGRSSFVINSANTTPFYINGGNQNGLLKAIADDHWSEDNRNSYAFWPRLNNAISENNSQASSWWLRNGSFLRLKTAEIGYNFSEQLLKKFHLSSGRLYVNGQNLATISAFKIWDPEMGDSGLGYPIQRVFNTGLSVGF